MHTCSWCATHYLRWQNQCDKCGGRMPPLPGQDLGPPPPEAPRKLPKSYEFRVKWSRNILVLVGGGFFLVGSLFFAAFIAARTWAALLPLLFIIGGLSMFWQGRKQALGMLRAFRHGIATQGKIASVSTDTSQHINGRHPWRLVYHFHVEGQANEGVITSFDSTIGQRASGQPLWVLYVPDDPSQNALYPPLV